MASLKAWYSLAVYCPEREHFVVAFDVITERKRAEEQLVRLNEELTRFNRLTVGRELPAIELKQQVNDLASGIPGRRQPLSPAEVAIPACDDPRVARRVPAGAGGLVIAGDSTVG